MDFKWLQNTFQTFTKQFFSYRGSLRRHDLCICNLIVLIANQIPLQKFGSLIGTQLVVSNIRQRYFLRWFSEKNQGGSDCHLSTRLGCEGTLMIQRCRVAKITYSKYFILVFFVNHNKQCEEPQLVSKQPPYMYIPSNK